MLNKRESEIKWKWNKVKVFGEELSPGASQSFSFTVQKVKVKKFV